MFGSTSALLCDRAALYCCERCAGPPPALTLEPPFVFCVGKKLASLPAAAAKLGAALARGRPGDEIDVAGIFGRVRPGSGGAPRIHRRGYEALRVAEALGLATTTAPGCAVVAGTDALVRLLHALVTGDSPVPASRLGVLICVVLYVAATAAFGAGDRSGLKEVMRRLPLYVDEDGECGGHFLCESEPAYAHPLYKRVSELVTVMQGLGVLKERSVARRIELAEEVRGALRWGPAVVDV